MPGSIDSSGDGGARDRMVDEQLVARGIDDPAVLRAMRAVPRHEFVPAGRRVDAYADRPLPIGHGATISQPYIVALMTQSLRLSSRDKVLEVGTGSGYAAAVIAEIVERVVTVETVVALAAAARARLRAYGNRVTVVDGDGSLGYPDDGPYTAISVAAAGPRVPPPLLEQLAPGGRLVMPVSRRLGWQNLVRITRTSRGFERDVLTSVRFVPLVGAHGDPRDNPGHPTD